VEEGMRFRVILEPSDEGGYTALVPALPGCISEGDTKEGALKNIQEAITLYLEPVEDDLDFAPDAELLEITL
jgi:predicted RNase H-like HicB family nuclease